MTCPSINSFTLEHGRWRIVNGSHYEYKTKVVFSCDPGYHGLGPASIECLPNGTWSWRTERPYCQSMPRLFQKLFLGSEFLELFLFQNTAITMIRMIDFFSVCMNVPLRHVAQPTFRILSSRVPGLQVWIIKTSETTPLIDVEFLSVCSEYVL